MNTLQLTSEISRNHDVAYTMIDKELVMLEPESAVFSSANCVGATLWSLLENKALSFESLCQYVHQHYAVTYEQCVADAMKFIQDMVDLKLLKITN